MEVPKLYKFIGFGAMEVTKPYEFIGISKMLSLKTLQGSYSMSRNSASGFIQILPGPIVGPIWGSIPWGSGPKMGPKRAPALLGHILGPDPHGMDPHNRSKNRARKNFN